MSQDLWRVFSFYAFMKEQLCALRVLEICLPPKKNLKLSAVRLRRLSDFPRGVLAAAGGEMGSH